MSTAVEKRVGEGEQRRNRTKTSTNGMTDAVLAGTELGDVTGGAEKDPDVGIAKAVDRLLAVADHEDRRLERQVVRQPPSLAPRLHQLPDQPPLRVARVLKLVDQQVVIARFEQKAALRELAHRAEEVEGARQRFGEIHDRVLIERAPVFLSGDGEHGRNAAGQHGVDIASERPDVLDDARSQRARNLEVRAARAFVGKRLLQVGRPFAGRRLLWSGNTRAGRPSTGAPSGRPARRLSFPTRGGGADPSQGPEIEARAGARWR